MSGADSAYADRQMQTNRGRMMNNTNIGQQSHPVYAITPQTLRPITPAEAATGSSSNSLSNRISPPSTMLSLMSNAGIQTARPANECIEGSNAQSMEQQGTSSAPSSTTVGTGTGGDSSSLLAPHHLQELDLVKFIERHLVRCKKAFPYKIAELETLAQMAVDSFAAQETLIEIFGPIFVCGDIHGQYSDLMRIFTACGAPHKSRYLFLGDFVDRGKHSIEVISLLLACKIQYPNHIYLLRGNHELSHINSMYGFQDELTTRFGKDEGELLWYRFNDVFSYMPLAATIGGRILCMHGGISPQLKSLDDIRRIEKPIPRVFEPGLIQDLLWSDPSPDIRFYAKNAYRNCSVMFGDEALQVKLRLLKIDKIIRAHQVEQYGYGTFAGGKLITVFSAPRYHPDMNNWAAVARITADLEITFTLLKPAEKKHGEKKQQQSQNY